MARFQSGFASLIVIVVLLLGLGAGVYLIQQKTNLFPKAGGGITIQIVDASGNPITTTSSALVQVKLTAPWDPVSSPPLSGPIKTYSASSCPLATAPSCPKGTGLISGSQNGCPVYKCVSEGSSCLPRPACLDSKPPCLRPEPEQGWCPSESDKDRLVKCKTDSDCNVGQYCPKSVCPMPTCLPGTDPRECKKLEKQAEKQCRISYCQTKPTPKPSSSLGTKVVLAEDPNFTVNVQTVSHTKTPFLTKYTFSDAKPGKKTVYARFEKQTTPSGPVASVNANPFPAVVELTGSQTLCKTGLSNYVVGKSCEGGNFLGATFECYDGFEGTLGDGKTCKSQLLWKKDAIASCEGRSSCPASSDNPSAQCQSDSDCGQGGRCLKACAVVDCASGRTDCPSTPPCSSKCVL